jgi:ABC-2 type transport system permease protein
MLARQVALIARRSIVRTVRQPANVIPPLTFPLMLMAVNSNGLEAATRLPGFPTDSFLDFFLPFSFMQGALFAASTAGTDLARDVDTGFLNRLALTPMRGLALIVGQLGGAVTMGEAVQSQFPIMFFLLFLSSMNLPRDLIEIEWFRIAATVNPASYMIEGLRVLIIEGWDAQALVLGFGFALAVIAISLGASAVALRQRMART